MPRSVYGTDLASVTETGAPVDLPIPLWPPPIRCAVGSAKPLEPVSYLRDLSSTATMPYLVPLQ